MGLVRTAFDLRLALLRGSLRGKGAVLRQIGLALGAVFGLGMALGALLGLIASRGHGHLPGDLSVCLFTALVVGWIVLPLLTFGSDDLLDPARLALLPLTRRELVTVMGVGALIGAAPIATVIAALGLLPAVGAGPSSYVVALVAVALRVALCVTASRAVASALAGLLRSRRGRDLGVILAAIAGLSVQLINPFVPVATRDGAGFGDDVLHGVAGPLRWTPAGWLATAPTRPLPNALGLLAAAAAVIVLLLAVWERSVRRALEQPDASGSRRRKATPLVPRGLPLPAGRVGAIAAKDLRYLVREPRRMIQMITGLALPLLVSLGPIALSGGHPSGAIVYVVCAIGLFGGLGAANRFGLDGTSTWLLVTSATDPRDARRDLLGGDLAIGLVMTPVIVVAALVLATISDGWVHLAPALGLALAFATMSVGMSGAVAVTTPFPVPESRNLFASGNAGQGMAASLSTVAAMGLQIALALPLLALLIPMWLVPAAWLGGVVLVAAPAYGLVIGELGRRWAARRWARKSPEVLQTLASAGT